MKRRARYSRLGGNPTLHASHVQRNRPRTSVACASLAEQWTARRSRARWCFAFLVFATIVFLTTTSFAQAPAMKSDKLDPALTQKATLSAMEQARKEGVTKPDLSPQWEKYGAFQAYYQKLMLGKFKDSAYLGELGTLTQTLIEDLDKANRARTPAAALLRGYALEIGKQIAPSPYHPIARINATMLLALADDASENPGERKPPVPAAAAFGPLVQLYRLPEAPDGVKAVALQGIARHVSLGAVTNPQFRAGVSKMMMDLATSPAPSGRSPEAHAFMQRYAVDILAILANPNASPDTAKTLVALSTSKDKPNLIAAYAASKMSSLQPGKQKLPNLPTVLQDWAARAATTIDGELTRIAKMDPPTAVNDQPAMPTEDTVPRTGGMDGYMDSSMMSDYMGDMGSGGMDMMSDYGAYDMEMMGGMYGMSGVPVVKPQPLEVITSRRRINHVLQQLQLGVTGQAAPGAPTKPAGLLGIADPADQAAFDAWIKTVSDVTTAINANTLDDRKKFVDELKKQSNVLKGLAGIAVEPAAANAGPGAAMGMPPLPGPAAPPAGGAMPAPGAAAPAPGVPAPGAVGPTAAMPGPVAPAPGAPAAPVAPAAAPVPPAAAAPVPPAAAMAPAGS